MKDPQAPSSILATSTALDEKTDPIAHVDTLQQTSELENPPKASLKEVVNTTIDHTEAENEESDEASDVAVGYDVPEDDDDINAAPMHLHALRIPARLVGSISEQPNSTTAANITSSSSVGGRRSRSTSRSRPRSAGSCGGAGSSRNSSRSSSPNTTRSHENNPTNNPHHATDTSIGLSSSYSSLDGMFNPDIFLDRMGFIDLDPPLPHEIRLGPLAAPDGKTSSSLTPVNERLCDETLEDSHAFQDLYCIARGDKSYSGDASMPSMAHSSLSGVGSVGSLGSIGMGSLDGMKGRHSREGSITGASVLDGDASIILETLDEVEDEEELGLDD